MNILDAIRSLFPEGSPSWRIDLETGGSDKVPRRKGGAPSWDQPPADPIDLFAVAAFLLSRSGAYHHVQPETDPPLREPNRRVEVTADDRTLWTEASRKWNVKFHSAGGDYLRLITPRLVRQLWKELLASGGEPLFVMLDTDQDAPSWWRTALALLVIGDEAAVDVGFLSKAPSLVHFAAESRIREMLRNPVGDEAEGIYTLSAAARDLVCVLPKSRTPSLGCTVRSLSHNLALLPPRGLARARWLAPLDPHEEVRRRPGTGAPLNLLLVPYPYQVPASAFRAVSRSVGQGSTEWGWFSVSPEAGDKESRAGFVDFVKALLEAARADTPEIHGLVFPELALSHDLYLDLVKALEDEAGIELLIAGLNTQAAREGRAHEGNFTVARIMGPHSKDLYAEDIRQKHHRWRLERNQIASYALGAQLEPSRYWWERLDVLSRTLTVGVLRGETTLATLICEDLARVDPAQELLRAIGPNIVIALLMDGPQLLTRWPNRYATVLAEDPGSSVLTLTSLGLIERVNRTGFQKPSRCVALWRDDIGVRELSLPPGAHALCLMLSPDLIEEATLDGRPDGVNSISWRLSGVQPVKLDRPEPAWIS
ncbi:MAG TPA: hypothetical protein VF759_11345 [Allosphingosinicella sp.]|jgi:hypothetical protein